jgi:anti-anti-sigma regulatory factor
MRQVRVSPEVARPSGVLPVERVVEVDGVLDAVTAHDLRRLLESVYAGGARHVQLDLSRVTYADVDGVAGLAWCSAHAVATGGVLSWSRCSTALLVALHHHPERRATTAS